MVCTIEIHPPATAQVEALPVRAAKLLMEVFAVLEIAPWSAGPLNDARPGAPVRTIPFGAMVAFAQIDGRVPPPPVSAGPRTDDPSDSEIDQDVDLLSSILGTQVLQAGLRS